MDLILSTDLFTYYPYLSEKCVEVVIIMSYKVMISSIASQKPSSQCKAHVDPTGSIVSHGRLGSVSIF